jgi:F-type H+-transporting ATPase subunit epsilon
MKNTFRLEIVTPERLFYSGKVEMVIVRTCSGDEGFMAGHTWACKLLDVGEIWIQEAGEKTFKIAAAAQGYIDVKDDVLIFVDAAEWPSDIDVSRAQGEKARAELWLSRHTARDTEESEILRAKVSLNKSLTRMKVAQGRSKR